jgi:F-type H+/Na+-transporting ATPase subunit alpha
MKNPNDALHSILENTFVRLTRAREKFAARLSAVEVGTVITVSAGVARATGLPGVGFDELVEFPGELFGIAFNVDEEEIGIVLLGDCTHLSAGAEVRRTGRVVDVPVGDGIIGRVIDPLGHALDEKGPVAFCRRSPIERTAPPIMDREPVTVPLQTGSIRLIPNVPGGAVTLSAASGRGRQGLRNVRQPAVGRDVKSRVLLLPESRNQMKRVIDTVTTLEDLVAYSSGKPET